MSTIFSLFGSLLLLGLVIAGLVLMVAPQLGRQLLKNTGIAASLSLLGLMLLQVRWSALHGSVRQFLSAVLVFIIAIVLMCAGLGYVFAPGVMHRLLKSVVTTIAFVFVMFLVAGGIARAAGPFVAMLLLALISVAAYAIRSQRVPHADRGRRLKGAESTPVMPRHLGDDL